MTVRSTVLGGLRLARAPLAAIRPLPSFLIVGAQKAGTSSLFKYLEQTSGLRASLTKEVHYFDHHYERGESWYRSHFPLVPSPVQRSVGESSPYYLLHPKAPARAAGSLPSVRLVALLRDPVSRAYSHFHHSRALGGEPLERFEEAVDAEAERTDAAWQELERSGTRQPPVEWFSYVRRSRYAPQLRRWLAHFPAESLLILTAEELYADPSGTVTRVRRHLGLPAGRRPGRGYATRNGRSYERLGAGARRRLGRLFVDDAHEVEEILGRPTGWQL